VTGRPVALGCDSLLDIYSCLILLNGGYVCSFSRIVGFGVGPGILNYDALFALELLC